MNDALRAALDPVILALLDRQPDHGYGLMRRIREVTGADCSDGSLYPALYRLEQAGKIEGSWTDGSSTRRKKVFRLTDHGRQTLKRQRDQWRPFAARLEVLLAPRSEGARG